MARDVGLSAAFAAALPETLFPVMGEVEMPPYP